MDTKNNKLANIIKDEKYIALVEEIKNTITESVRNSRWVLVKGYWLIGKLMREEYESEITKLLQGLAVDVGVSERTLWYSLQAYDKFPELDKIPEGKNISWNKLITLYLPEPKKEKTPELPEGKYQVIYADPPWAYDVDLSSGATRSPENNYPVMDLDALIEFGEKVKEISADDCILFMWTTAPKLNWMNDVLEAWGFEYKTNLIWDKIKPNLGHYSSVRHEILIIAGRGICSPTCDGKTIQSIDSVQSIEKSSRHSEKPEEFRKIIETLYPNKKYIELFARGIAPEGWIFWGNQANE